MTDQVQISTNLISLIDDCTRDSHMLVSYATDAHLAGHKETAMFFKSCADARMKESTMAYDLLMKHMSQNMTDEHHSDVSAHIHQLWHKKHMHDMNELKEKMKML